VNDHRVAADAQKIAETVDAVWHAHRGGSRIDVPVGVIAALALSQDNNTGQGLSGRVLAMLDAQELPAMLRRVWAVRWCADPYLVDMARPIHGWLEEDLSEQTVTAAFAVAEAAAEASLLDLVGGSDPYERAQVDVLGPVVATMRSRGAHKSLGEFPTPGDIADLLVHLKFGGEVPEPGASFDDSQAGTGGLLRAGAQLLRELGQDPRDYCWSMGEVDAVSAACCATNAMLWDLGPNVLVFTGDCLVQPNGPELAAQHRAEVLQHHARLLNAALFIGGIRRAQSLLSSMFDDLPARGNPRTTRTWAMTARSSPGRRDHGEPGR
jgi:hypothetical protein